MKLKSIIKYIVIYIIVVLCYQYLLYFLKLGDSITLFSFSHAIRREEVIYKDFNSLITPLYVILMSLGLYVYDSYITFVLEQSFIVTIMIYFLEKILDKKLPLFLFIILLPLPTFSMIFTMSYNFLVLLWICIIYYLEKNYPNKDYLIGFIVGLCILTKQSIGGLLLIPMFIICNKNKNKLFKRFIGVVVPCIIFFIYLIINRNLGDFINLCFLGLFDFGEGNSHLYGVYFYLSIIIFIISLVFIIRHKDLKYNYYLIPTLLFAYPIFDIYHFSLYIFSIILMFIDYLDINNNYIFKLGIVLDIIIFIVYLVSIKNIKFINYPYMKYFDTMTVAYDKDKLYDDDFKYFDKYCKNKDDCIIFGYLNLFYNISNDYGINYFSVNCYGNHGYNGTDNLIKRIKKSKAKYIIVEGNGYGKLHQEYDQRNYKVLNYVKNNYKRIDSWSIYDVYYKE